MNPKPENSLRKPLLVAAAVAAAVSVMAYLAFFRSPGGAPPVEPEAGAPTGALPAGAGRPPVAGTADGQRPSTEPSRVPGVTLPSAAPAPGPGARPPGSAPAAVAGEAFSAQEPASVPGRPATAEAMVPGRAEPKALRPNSVGVFERLQVEPNAQVPFAVRYPDVTPGRKVQVTVQDGGSLEAGKPTMNVPVGMDGMVRFTFTTGGSRGIYRIELRHGADVKFLEVWAGRELALAP